MTTGPEGFLQRWSRRKREAATRDPVARAPEPESPATADGPSDAAPAPPAVADAPVPAVDLESLPSLESITAETDVTGFLARGVPTDLTRAALRRAWLADPQIRDFIGIAENQWDFTAPDGLHGFGPLDEAEARVLVEDILRQTSAITEATAPEPTVSETTSTAATPAPLNQDERTTALDVHQALPEPGALRADAALQHEKAAVKPLPVQRKVRHGSALPD